MNKKLMRANPGIGVLAAVVLLAVCLVSAPVWASEEGAGFRLQVSGRAELTADPDYAVVQSAVEASADTPAEASALGEEKYQRVSAALEKLGVKLVPGYYSLHPRYDYGTAGRAPEIVGYTSSRQIEVTVSDLAKVGEVLDALIEAGVEAIHGVRFALSQTEELRAKAIAAALADAESQAKAVATATEARIAGIVEISLGEPSPIPMVMAAREDASAFAPSPVTVSSYVTVVYQLEK